MREPRNAERRPRRKGGALNIAHGGGDKSIVLVPAQRRPHDACWRCGTEFAATDLDALRRCAELARAAS